MDVRQMKPENRLYPDLLCNAKGKGKSAHRERKKDQPAQNFPDCLSNAANQTGNEPVGRPFTR
jgi:hypothetical protein